MLQQINIWSIKRWILNDKGVKSWERKEALTLFIWTLQVILYARRQSIKVSNALHAVRIQPSSTFANIQSVRRHRKSDAVCIHRNLKVTTAPIFSINGITKS